VKSRPTGSSGGGVGMERWMRYRLRLRLPNPGSAPAVASGMLALPAGMCRRLCISVLCRAFMMPSFR
jgi:hypothetical protein